MTLVKICGITNLEDALTCAQLGADMLGFNFYGKSPRYIEPTTAADISKQIPDRVLKVGVFVNMEAYRIDEFVSMIGLDAVQIHGDESTAFLDELRSETHAKIIRACHVKYDHVPDLITTSADYILFDSDSTAYGGSGEVFDWTIIGSTGGLRKRMILAGGLTPDNIAEAINIVRPFAVDVASGVESSPGKKDPKKVAAFIKAAKEAI